MTNDDATPAIDAKALLDRCGNNADLARRLAGRFIREAPAQVAVMHDVLRGGNTAELARLLHKLRGSLGIFGATVAHETAAALEERARSTAPAECESMLADLESEVRRACDELAVFGS